MMTAHLFVQTTRKVIKLSVPVSELAAFTALSFNDTTETSTLARAVIAWF